MKFKAEFLIASIILIIVISALPITACAGKPSKPGTRPTTVTLQASTLGAYRWLDVANYPYSSNYRTTYYYSSATVTVSFLSSGSVFEGTLTAKGLKPNFAYQLKLEGIPGTASNELIGLVGRWWQEEWSGTAWINGLNLNNKGSGTSPNPNDITYSQNKGVPDSTSPTGYHYRYTGYLIFKYFITDSRGAAKISFRADSSYHVLWKTTQATHTSSDGPIVTSSFDPNPNQLPYGSDYPPATVNVFGEWERLPVGATLLKVGQYKCKISLTEESFHGDGGTYSGNWAKALEASISFKIK